MPNSVRKLVRMVIRADPLGEFGRTLTAVLVASLVVYGLPDGVDFEVLSAVSWNVWAVVYLGLTWFMMFRSSPERTRRWALNQRGARRSCLLRILLVFFLVGRTGNLLFIILISLVGLSSALSLLPQMHEPDTLPGGLVVGLNVLGVVAAWAVLHTAYGLYYAYLYYRSEGSHGGLAFPGNEEPNQLDFAYFSFTIAANLAVADVMVTDPAICRTVLGHIVLSFAYNAAILAMVVNLVVNLVIASR